jgi:hypothetical protein
MHDPCAQDAVPRADSTDGLDPYRPPGAQPAFGAQVSSTGQRSARLAGAFFTLNAILSAVILLVSTRRRMNAFPLPALNIVALVAPGIAAVVGDGLLAIPLLRGSVRFRVITWMRGVLSLVLPLAAYSMSAVARRHGLFAMGRVEMLIMGRLVVRGGLLAAGLLLLVTTRPSRPRMVAGAISLLGHLCFHII